MNLRRVLQDTNVQEEPGSVIGEADIHIDEEMAKLRRNACIRIMEDQTRTFDKLRNDFDARLGTGGHQVSWNLEEAVVDYPFNLTPTMAPLNLVDSAAN